MSFSPHAWGWTVKELLEWKRNRVFPTRVGVDRRVLDPEPQCLGFPHTRGGGPHLGARPMPLPIRFPHTRGGGPIFSDIVQEAEAVFPTRVGVDRDRLVSGRWARAFSPHAWGWTMTIQAPMITPTVFPTRVGVDRSDFSLTPTSSVFSPHAWGWTS